MGVQSFIVLAGPLEPFGDLTVCPIIREAIRRDLRARAERRQGRFGAVERFAYACNGASCLLGLAIRQNCRERICVATGVERPGNNTLDDLRVCLPAAKMRTESRPALVVV